MNHDGLGVYDERIELKRVCVSDGDGRDRDELFLVKDGAVEFL